MARYAKQFAVSIERIDPEIVWLRDRGICAICGKPVRRDKVSLDHAVPLTRGGEHSYRNLRATHFDCNRRKNARGPGQPRLF